MDTAANDPGTSSSDLGASQGTSSSLEVIERQDPIHAWRKVTLRPKGNGVVLRSTQVKKDDVLSTRSENEAKCNLPHTTHTAPHPGCECGFYAVKSRDHSVLSGGWQWVAEVDLFGLVIEHETGYRAQYMRILALHVRNHDFCESDKFMCDGKPIFLYFKTAEGRPDRICRDCAESLDRVVTLSQVARRLGIEVRWFDD